MLLAPTILYADKSTSSEISAAVAAYVDDLPIVESHWLDHQGKPLWKWRKDKGNVTPWNPLPNYEGDANAIIPLILTHGGCEIYGEEEEAVEVWIGDQKAEAATFSRAACLVLLKCSDRVTPSIKVID